MRQQSEAMVQTLVLKGVVTTMTEEEQAKVSQYIEELRHWFRASGGMQNAQALTAFAIVGLEAQDSGAR